MILPEQLKATRHYLGMTRPQLAKAAGVSIGAIDRFENGHNILLSSVTSIEAYLNSRGIHIEFNGVTLPRLLPAA